MGFLDIIKKEPTMKDGLKFSAIQSMADNLMSWGFAPQDAFQTSESFWNKHKNKLRSVV